MKNNIIKKVLSVSLAWAVAVCMPLGTEAFAQAEIEDGTGGTYSDTRGHWAADQIEKWSALDVIQGSTGKFRPGDAITRGDLAMVIDRIMGYQISGDNLFSDLSGKEYFADAVLKVNAAGVLYGDSGMVKARDFVTREEAVAILARSFSVQSAKETDNTFLDGADISQWAVPIVSAMAEKGYVSGRDGKFLPKNNISRAEVVTIINNMISGLITKSGTYTENVGGNLIIGAPGVTLKNMTVSGNLLLAPGVGEGDVTMENITVLGDTSIQGGGIDSIVVKGASDLGKVSITKSGGMVRVATENSAVLETVVIEDGSDGVILEGSFGEVEVSAPGVTVTLKDALVEKVQLTGEKAKLVLKGKSTIDTLILNAQGVRAEGEKDARIKKAIAENGAPGAALSGQMAVERAEIKTENVAVDTVGTRLSVADGISGTTSNGYEVAEGKTVITTASRPRTSSGSRNSSRNKSITGLKESGWRGGNDVADIPGIPQLTGSFIIQDSSLTVMVSMGGKVALVSLSGPTTVESNYGTLLISPQRSDSGHDIRFTYTYFLNNEAGSATDRLAEDETCVDNATINVSDGEGHTVNQTIHITITGTNDAPDITNMAEIQGKFTGRIEAVDPDNGAALTYGFASVTIGNDTIPVAPASESSPEGFDTTYLIGEKGSLYLNSQTGTYHFEPVNGAGITETDISYTPTVNDQHGGSDGDPDALR